MSLRLLKTAGKMVVAIATFAWAAGWGSVSLYAQCGCGNHAGHGVVYAGVTGSHAGHVGHNAGSTGHQYASVPGDQARQDRPAPPRGGQLTVAPPLIFEVVYLPQEIRVYLYGRWPQPESVKDVTGEVSLQRPNDDRPTRVALRYVEQPAGQQDYLAAPIDLSRVRDGELTATVRLANLPLENRPGITFGQAVVVSQARPQVALAALDASDQTGIARQRTCPVTGAALGSMGDPIKVLVGGQPLYLCCKGCLSKVQSAPEAYLRKASQASRVQ